MSNAARSKYHQWVVAPDGGVFRQRLTVKIKDGWRAATWDEIGKDDPAAAEAWRYKRELDIAAATVNGEARYVLPPLAERIAEEPPALDAAALIDKVLTNLGAEVDAGNDCHVGDFDVTDEEV